MIALGVLAMFASVGRVTLVTTTLLGVVYAYVVRFVPLSTVTVDASLEKVTPSVVMAARTLGARPGRILRRIHLPMLRSGAAAALLLVFVHTLQELSIVLLLRPFNYDTLAVLVFGLTQNSAWEETGLPALTIVAVALVPGDPHAAGRRRGERAFAVGTCAGRSARDRRGSDERLPQARRAAEALRRRRRRRRGLPRPRHRRAPGADRPERLRQVDDPA